MLPSSLQGHLSPYMNRYASIPTSFAAQAANGFSSSNFDLEANIAGDSRAGLDDSVLGEIRDIMHREHVKCVQFYAVALARMLTPIHLSCSFDEARLIRHKLNMARNGVDPRTGEALRVQRFLQRDADLVFCPGLPTDAKAITRL